MLTYYEVIDTILELIKNIAKDPRIEHAATITVMLCNPPGFPDPDIIVRLKGPYYSESPITAEIVIFRTGDDESPIHIDVYALDYPKGSIDIAENVNLKNLADITPYFEKLMALFEPRTTI